MAHNYSGSSAGSNGQYHQSWVPSKHYSNTLYLTWEITTASGSHIQLSIRNMSIEPGCCDFLIITEFGREKYRFNGNIRALSPFVFESSHLVVHFVTDDGVTFPGFFLQVQRTYKQTYYPIASCGYQAFGNTQPQPLLSLQYPYNYLNNRRCSWTLAAQKNYCLLFTIILFRTEIYDTLTIESQSRRMLVFDGTNHTLPLNLPPLCGFVYITFKTDHSCTESGFASLLGRFLKIFLLIRLPFILNNH